MSYHRIDDNNGERANKAIDGKDEERNQKNKL